MSDRYEYAKKRIEAWIVVSVWVVALAALAATPSLGKDKGPGAAQIALDEALYRAEFLAPLDGPVVASNGLPHLTPFWVDMVDAEDLPVDGEGVYVAVLDTGLVPEWPLLFPEADVAWELGKGFSYDEEDIHWDAGIGDFVFENLDDERGFLTKDIGSGHGTHVTSTIVGFDFSGTYWIEGVAPRATIIPVLVLDTWLVDCPSPESDDCHGGKILLGGGTDEMVSAGIYYVADLAESLDGPVVISMSLGGPEPSPMIEEAIDYAISQGCLVVVSAGNSGDWGMEYPGGYPQVISCGAAGWTENWVNPGWWFDYVPEKLNTPDYWGNNWQLYLEDFSSRPSIKLGQRSHDLDVCAPGAAIVGPYQPEVFWNATLEDWDTSPTGYYYLWGTSMAAPHVSGISALVLESHDYSQSQLEKTLKLAAKGLPLPGDGSWVYDPWYGIWHFEWSGNDWGSGFLQADAALDKAK